MGGAVPSGKSLQEGHLRIRLMSVALSSLLLLPAVAKADTFTFSSTGSGGGFSGTGLLTASNNGDGSFTVTGISGTGITGLISPNGFFNDNLLFPSGSRLVDVNGLGFTTLVGGIAYSVDIFSTVSGYEAFTLDSDGNFGDDPVTFAIRSNGAVPEPSSLVMMGSGVLALAAGLRRRFV
jgi:PEP-CTERM motif